LFVLFFAFGALILSSFPSGLVRSFRCNVWREVLLPRRYHVPESLSCVQHGIWKARPLARGFTTNLRTQLRWNPRQTFVQTICQYQTRCRAPAHDACDSHEHGDSIGRHMTETRLPLYRSNSGHSSWSRTRDGARATLHVNHTWTKIFRLFLAATSSLEIETKRMIQDEEGAVAVIMI